VPNFTIGMRVAEAVIDALVIVFPGAAPRVAVGVAPVATANVLEGRNLSDSRTRLMSPSGHGFQGAIWFPW
jgi:hypothetical protein